MILLLLTCIIWHASFILFKYLSAIKKINDKVQAKWIYMRLGALRHLESSNLQVVFFGVCFKRINGDLKGPYLHFLLSCIFLLNSFHPLFLLLSPWAGKWVRWGQGRWSCWQRNGARPSGKGQRKRQVLLSVVIRAR